MYSTSSTPIPVVNTHIIKTHIAYVLMYSCTPVYDRSVRRAKEAKPRSKQIADEWMNEF